MSKIGTIDDEGVFRHACDVRFHDTERTLRLTPFALYGHLQESAIRHSSVAGYSAELLVDRGWAWVQNRVHLQIDRYPAWQEQLVIETWAFNLSGLYAVREFRVRDADENIVVRGTSRWILLDTNRLRPIRIPEELGEGYKTNSERVIDDEFPRMRPPENPTVKKEFHVRLSDLDTNRHTNAGCYLEWCIEAAPPEIHNGYMPTSIEVMYKKESILSDPIRAEGAEAESSDSTHRTFEHAIYNAKTNDVLAIGRSRWTSDAEYQAAAPTGLKRG